MGVLAVWEVVRRSCCERFHGFLAAWLLVLALAALDPGVATAQTSVGYQGPSYSGAGTDPTASKPESKLWWNDGFWWASMWDTGTSDFHIFKLNEGSQTWVDTGVAIDPRQGTRADTLWDGTKLYVASHAYTTTSTTANSGGQPVRLWRYSYDSAADRYGLDAGFPVTITNYKTETFVIAKDSVGTLWATWVQDSKVYISHTTTSDLQWTTPYVLPVDGATGLNSDDISSVVAFAGNKIGVMWSNQTTSQMLFAVHVDGVLDSVWTRELAVGGAGNADDHINLKAADDGRVFAATKTSQTAGTAPLVLLLERDPLTTTWKSSVFATVSDRSTRPIVLLDEQNDMVYVLATGSETGGTIFLKSSPMNAISFAAGKGTPFIRDVASETMHNVTSTKQNLNSDTHLVALAGHSATRFYWHNFDILAPPTPDTTPPTAPSNLSATAAGANQVDLSWTAATDDVGIDNYDVYRDGVFLATIGAATTYSDTTVSPSTTYTYEVRARDHAGNLSGFSNGASATTPAAPTTLTFGPGSDARVEEANPSSNFGTSILRTDAGTGVNIESYLRFTVTGLSGTVEGAKLRVFASSGTNNGPAVHTATNTTWSETGITWSNRPQRSATGVDDKAAITASTWVEWDITSLVSGDGTYTFVLRTDSTDGVDFHAREGTNKPELVVTLGNGTPDTTPPTAPTGLTATAVGGNQVNLSWTAATDDVAVENYQIYRNGVLVDTVGAVTAYSDTTVSPSTTYQYQVKARDHAGNVSDFSNTATVTTPAAAATVKFGAAADARVEEASSTTNFGTSTALKADGAGDPDIDSYLRFTVTGVSGTVTSAKLRVYASTGTANGPAVHTATDTSWSETGITWSNRPARSTTGVDDKAAIGGSTWVEYDVTPLVSGNGTYTLVLATSSNDGITFHSREGTNKPELVLTLG